MIIFLFVFFQLFTGIFLSLVLLVHDFIECSKIANTAVTSRYVLYAQIHNCLNTVGEGSKV